MFGSTPTNTIASRSLTRAEKKRFAGQSMRRVVPSTSRTVGRCTWKSKNSSGSISAKRRAPHWERSVRAAVVAASPPSFQPPNAQIITGFESWGRAR